MNEYRKWALIVQMLMVSLTLPCFGQLSTPVTGFVYSSQGAVEGAYIKVVGTEKVLAISRSDGSFECRTTESRLQVDMLGYQSRIVDVTLRYTGCHFGGRNRPVESGSGVRKQICQENQEFDGIHGTDPTGTDPTNRAY